MICPPCREAADSEARLLRSDPLWFPVGHGPTLCRDEAIQPGGCACQHRPVNADAEPASAT